MSAERAHLSIGEVLSLLQEEFPDITISKIRFLESQGLLDPERTPSGYRKFYEADIDRLRWILRQQRENFLPLKVIKEKLAKVPIGAPPDDDGLEAAVDTDSSPQGGAANVSGGDGRRPAPLSGSDSRQLDLSAKVATGRRASERGAGSRPDPSLFDTGPSSVSMTLDDLATATGVSTRDLEKLERIGMLVGRDVGSERLYDADALLVAQLAAGFLRYGVEVRHLRMYKVSAEREGGLLEQLVMPLLKQRNPASRQEAIDRLGEFARLGEGLRAAMLRQALRDYGRSGGAR